MSYARFSDESDVYVYEDISLGLRCCGCPLQESGPLSVAFGADVDALAAHLAEHEAAGHNVPTGRILADVRHDQAADAAERHG